MGTYPGSDPSEDASRLEGTTSIACDTKYWDASILQYDSNEDKFETVREFFTDYLRLRGRYYANEDNRDRLRASEFYDNVRRAALKAGLNHVVCIAATCKFPHGNAQIQYAVRKTRGVVCRSWIGSYGTFPPIGIGIELEGETDYVEPAGLAGSIEYTEDIGVLADTIRRAADCLGAAPLHPSP
jgi:hypothetical protein